MATPSARECAALLLETVPGLMRSIAGAVRQRADCDEEAPTLGQLRMLTMLGEHSWSLSELAARHHVTPSSMSRMIDVLVQRAWVARADSPDDRRKVVLQLTPAGQEAHQTILHAAVDSVADLIDQLDDVDRTRLYDGLHVLRALVMLSCLPVDHHRGDE